MNKNPMDKILSDAVETSGKVYLDVIKDVLSKVTSKEYQDLVVKKNADYLLKTPRFKPE